MITRKNQTSLEQSQDFKSYSFGIKKEGISHIFNVLRNQLYSDKILAVIREYSCNAVDAHTEIGKNETPIVVTLPTNLSLELKVRDFGRGLTETEIGEIYAMYGESTKRGTNEQIGQLGLGCKSAFAYGDNFIINSYVNGKRVSYNAFIDPSQVGRISKLSEEESKAKSGIEIVIPVKLDDVDEFYHKAVGLFKYFKVTPTIKGASGRNLDIDLNDETVIFTNDDESWKLVQGQSVAIMGNIAYEISSEALNLSWSNRHDTQEGGLYELVNAGIRLTFEIGDLDIAASREALQYNDRTKSIILKRLKSCLKEIPVVLGKRFEDCSTLWDAKLLFDTAFSHGGFGHHIRKVVEKKGIKWVNSSGKTITVNDSQFDLTQWKNDEATVYNFCKTRRGYGTTKRVKGEEMNHIVVKDKTLVIIDDRPSHQGRLNSIAPLVEEYEGRDENVPLYDFVYLLKFGSPKDRKDFVDKTGFDFPAINLSAYPKVKLRDIYPSNQTAKGSSTVKPEKHQTKEFVFDKDCDKNKWHQCRSDFFNSCAVDIDNEEGIYLKIDGFWIGENQGTHPSSITKEIKAIEAFGIKVPDVYGFKRGIDDKKWTKLARNDNWKLFHVWAKEKILEKLKKDDSKQQILDRHTVLQHQRKSDNTHGVEILHLDGRGKNDESEIKVSEHIVDEKSPFLTYFLNCNEMANKRKGDKYDKIIGLFQRMNILDNLIEEYTPTYDLDTSVSMLKERYPMLTLVDWHEFGWPWKKEYSLTFFNYVNIIDITHHSSKRKADNIFEETDKKKESKPKAKKTLDLLTRTK
jgi:hypothetical protein